MPDGSHPAIFAEMPNSADRTQPVGLRHKLVAGLLLTVGLIFCGLIALVSIAVALVATVLNGLRALKRVTVRGREKSPATTSAQIPEV